MPDSQEPRFRWRPTRTEGIAYAVALAIAGGMGLLGTALTFGDEAHPRFCNLPVSLVVLGIVTVVYIVRGYAGSGTGDQTEAFFSQEDDE